MRWSILMNAAGLSAIVIGILLLIWSLARGRVSELGVTLVLAGLLLELLAWLKG